MSLYQFIVAVRQGDSQTNLTNDAGEVTSHIQGFVSRTVKLMELGIPHPHFHPRLSLSPHLSPSASLSPSPPQVKMMELGIKPVYVFDGKPPALKSGELATREEKNLRAQLRPVLHDGLYEGATLGAVGLVHSGGVRLIDLT